MPTIRKPNEEEQVKQPEQRPTAEQLAAQVIKNNETNAPNASVLEEARQLGIERKVLDLVNAQTGDQGETIEQFRQKQELVQTAEQAGVFENRPDRVELSPTEAEQRAPLDIARGLTSPTRFIFGVDTTSFVNTVFGDGEASQERIEDLIQNPETLRQKMLQEIQREELDKAQTTSQRLGSALEPFVGDLKIFDVDIGGYVDKFVRMPKQEADEIVSQIQEMEGVVSGMTDAAAQGEIGNPAEVLRDIAKKEEDLAVLEARLKRLILSSEELRANPEQVNIIEEQILKTRETFFEAKQRAAEGALVTPTNEQLFYKLQSVRGKYGSQNF